MLNFMRFIHLLSVAVWIGALVFFSFFAAPSLFRVLSREAAGEAVGSIFPKYWMIGYAGGVLGLSSLLVISFLEKSFPALRIALLVLMTALTFYNGLSVAPRAREAKLRVRIVQDEPAKEAITVEFKRLHRVSSVLNAAVIIMGVAFIFFMSRSLRL